jgi:hypothetical protein
VHGSSNLYCSKAIIARQQTSVADLDPEMYKNPELDGRIRIRSGTEINFSDMDSEKI